MGDVIINARITGTSLGVEDHGILSSWLNLDFDGSGQGFGGYCFDEPVWGPGGRAAHDFKGRRGCAFGMEYIRRLMEVVGVEKWEDLKGKYVRVRKADRWGAIEAIGNIIKDDWFDPKALAAQMCPKESNDA